MKGQHIETIKTTNKRQIIIMLSAEQLTELEELEEADDFEIEDGERSIEDDILESSGSCEYSCYCFPNKLLLGTPSVLPRKLSSKFVQLLIGEKTQCSKEELDIIVKHMKCKAYFYTCQHNSPKLFDELTEIIKSTKIEEGFITTTTVLEIADKMLKQKIVPI